MLIKNLIFSPQITFFINIVVFCSFSRFGFPTSGSGCRSGRGNSRGLPVYFHFHPSHRINSRANHTHKTSAFRWRQSGFLRLRLHDMVLILPILLYTFLHGIFKLPAPMIDSMLFVPIGLENVCSKI